MKNVLITGGAFGLGNYLAKAFKENNIKSKMIMQVHDELIFDCLNEEKERVAKLVKDIMENVIKLSVPIIVSQDFGNNWYNTK